MANALLFPSGATEAIQFYQSIFPDCETLEEANNPADGKHLATTLKLRGVEFVMISGGPECVFSMATSFMIYCDTQDEVDMFWEKLGDGGEIHFCGWLTDKFGITWQVTPAKMGEWMATGTPEQSAAVFGALMEMEKVDLAKLETAWLNAAPK